MGDESARSPVRCSAAAATIATTARTTAATGVAATIPREVAPVAAEVEREVLGPSVPVAPAAPTGSGNAPADRPPASTSGHTSAPSFVLSRCRSSHSAAHSAHSRRCWWTLAVMREETSGPEGGDPPVPDESGAAGPDADESRAEEPDGQLARTGTSLGLALVAVMLALFGAGGALMWRGRRGTP